MSPVEWRNASRRSLKFVHPACIEPPFKRLMFVNVLSTGRRLCEKNFLISLTSVKIGSLFHTANSASALRKHRQRQDGSGRNAGNALRIAALPEEGQRASCPHRRRCSKKAHPCRRVIRMFTQATTMPLGVADRGHAAAAPRARDRIHANRRRRASAAAAQIVPHDRFCPVFPGFERICRRAGRHPGHPPLAAKKTVFIAILTIHQ